mgnify:CR=1 FL=1
MSADVENLGNSHRDLVIEIVPTDVNGTILADSGLSISHEGWAAIILSRAELDSMPPGGDARAQVQVQAPERYPGNLQFNIIVWDVAANEDLSSVSQRVSIVPRSGGLMTISENTCSTDTSPGGHCSALLRIENTGDVTSSFEIKIGETPDWLDITLEKQEFSVGPGQAMNGIVLTFAVLNGTQADLESQISISLWLGDWSPANLSLSVIVGEYYQWRLESSSTEISGDNNLSSKWTLTNLGNEADGLVVSVDSNLLTQYAINENPNATRDSVIRNYT